jgi:hypothetical protein
MASIAVAYFFSHLPWTTSSSSRAGRRLRSSPCRRIARAVREIGGMARRHLTNLFLHPKINEYHAQHTRADSPLPNVICRHPRSYLASLANAFTYRFGIIKHVNFALTASLRELNSSSNFRCNSAFRPMGGGTAIVDFRPLAGNILSISLSISEVASPISSSNR